MTFYTLSYLKVIKNYQNTEKSKIIYNSILEKEKNNGMPEDIINSAKIIFQERYDNINWEKYFNNLPFNKSALALYDWAPIAEEL